MKEETSLYIDILRVGAAGAVFMQHSYYFTGEAWGKPLSQFGADAVAIFFVISGFVITFSTFRRSVRASDYILARLRRLYTVAIPALMLALTFDYVGRKFGSLNYYGRSWYNASTSFYDLFRYITFSNEYWGSHIIVGSNEPFWSVGYEANYYILFGLFVFLRNSISLAIVSIVLSSVIFGPNIILYFPLWLMGVGLYFLVVKEPTFVDRFPQSIWLPVYLSSIALLYFWHRHTGSMYEKFDFSLNQLGRACYFYGLGLIVSLNILFFSAVTQRGLRYMVLAKRPIRWVAGGTFTLYLVHQPILICLSSLFPNNPGSVARALAIQICTLAICFLLAEVFERRTSHILNITSKLVLSLQRVSP